MNRESGQTEILCSLICLVVCVQVNYSKLQNPPSLSEVTPGQLTFWNFGWSSKTLYLCSNTAQSFWTPSFSSHKWCQIPHPNNRHDVPPLGRINKSNAWSVPDTLHCTLLCPTTYTWPRILWQVQTWSSSLGRGILMAKVTGRCKVLLRGLKFVTCGVSSGRLEIVLVRCFRGERFYKDFFRGWQKA